MSFAVLLRSQRVPDVASGAPFEAAGRHDGDLARFFAQAGGYKGSELLRAAGVEGGRATSAFACSLCRSEERLRAFDLIVSQEKAEG